MSGLGRVSLSGGTPSSRCEQASPEQDVQPHQLNVPRVGRLSLTCVRCSSIEREQGERTDRTGIHIAVARI